jgi:uncharacterized protein (DUF58 family)
MIEALRDRFALRWQRWLDRRIPSARSVTLDQSRIFIFPSRVGLWFLVVLGLMLTVAINYQNNMAFALTFFLFSLFVVAILHTFANLSGLQLEAVRAAPVFAGDTAEFEIYLRRTPRRRYHSIQLGWPGQPLTEVSLVETEQQSAKVFHATQRRGWLVPGRLLVQSFYPLGLLRAWTWIDLDFSALVYPQPLACPRPAGVGEGQAEGEIRQQLGSEDFYGFRLYRSGDNPRHVLWRARAKGLPLQTKQFSELTVQTQWLDWEALTGDRELRLSQLCHWVLELHRQNVLYGVRLPGETIALGTGTAQREHVLQRLATFGLTAPASKRGARRNG